MFLLNGSIKNDCLRDKHCYNRSKMSDYGDYGASYKETLQGVGERAVA